MGDEIIYVSGIAIWLDLAAYIFTKVTREFVKRWRLGTLLDGDIMVQSSENGFTGKV